MKKSLSTIALACVALSMQAGSGVQIRRNQVGMYPQQEKVVVIEGTNPRGKLRVTTPDGRVLKPRQVRKAVSPLSGKTRYVVDLGDLTLTGAPGTPVHFEATMNGGRITSDCKTPE